MDERRKNPRRRVLKSGTISFDRGESLDCVVRNISELGACLELESRVNIPADFTLIVKTAKMIRLCHVVWRAGRRIGVSFQSAEARATARVPE
jgi:methyl-accepting chemotaxis protein